MKTYIECETCNGTGEVMISCCSGEVIDDDFAICPECHEHLGDEPCPDCAGECMVEDDKELTPVRGGVQAKAEQVGEEQFETAREGGDIKWS
jgi:DnaJ-class molecular chaperone